MIRILLVDDEPLAVQRIAGLLRQIEDIEIAGTADGGEAAVEQARLLDPDAILLDIEMPIVDGFDVAERIAHGEMPKPFIIFVTAFPNFAAPAFDSGAIDFLTKPVRLSRLETAIARLREAIVGRSAKERLRELTAQLDGFRQQRDGRQSGDHLWVHGRGEAVRVDLDRLEWVAAEGEYVRLHIGGASYLHREALTTLMERLDPDRFIRIHRSYAVDRGRVVSVRRRATGSYQLQTDAGRTLPVGRSYRAAVREMMRSRSPR
ncbi:MAG TPA: LytTR family DNA-binding domain-containing protein [Allosphingosinicella sp.]|nr:LytTR family DNA-binding domain-containing protein [Allosphingosinicella sp.]